MVGPAVGNRAFDRHEVRDLLDDAEGGCFPLGVDAHFAQGVFGEAAAALATSDRVGGGLQGREHGRQLGGTFDQEV